jgi:hypothetical protein
LIEMPQIPLAHWLFTPQATPMLRAPKGDRHAAIVFPSHQSEHASLG